MKKRMQERMLGELLYYNHVKPAKKENAKCIKGKKFVIQDRRKGRRVNMQIDDNNRCASSPGKSCKLAEMGGGYLSPDL